MPLTASKKYKVTVSQDKLSATLAINGDSLPQDATVKDILAEISELGVKVNSDKTAIIDEFVKAITESKHPEPVIVATGTPPVADKNGYVKKLYTESEKPEPAAPADESDSDEEQGQSVTCSAETQMASQPNNGEPGQSHSHYDKSCYVFIDADQPVAQIMPPVDGTDGTDIYGEAIPRAKGLTANIRLGKNVRFGDPKKEDAEEQEDIIYANLYGKLGHTTAKIWIEEDLEVHSDVDFSIGNIDFNNNVNIFRNVLDLFKVRAGKNLTVRGVVEAAQVGAGENIYLRGGMAGKEKGKVSAGQNIECKFITSSHISCGGDLLLTKEVMYCDIECGGAITSETGQLAGGNISVFKGVTVHTLGSDAGTKTVLEVGINDELKNRAATTKPEVKVLRMKAEKVREVVEPLLVNQKRLSNEQKEKATELLYETYELDSKADELIEKLKEAYLHTLENSVLSVTVLGKIHPNVTIRFPRGESKITSEIEGPVTITPEIVNKVTRLKATNTKTGNSKILDYGTSYDEQWNEIEDYLGLK